MELTLSDLKKCIYGDEYLPLIPDLLIGITKEDLEKKIAAIKNVPVTHASVPIARMNLVGGFRSWGYLVDGGRQGRDKPYKITGWVEKKEKLIASQWVGVARDRLRWVHSLPTLTQDDELWVRDSIGNRPQVDRLHECSWLYPWCYEGARDSMWVFDHMIIMARFHSYPRFRLFNLDADVKDLLATAAYIAPCSCNPVYIVNPSLTQMKDLKRGDPNGSFGKRLQAIYRVEDIALRPEMFLNKRALEQLRSNEKHLKYVDNPSQQAQINVVDKWRITNEVKMRQLAITRDYVAIKSSTVNKITLLGERDGIPACLHLLDPSANVRDMVCQINEKSLNYSSQLGGHVGTADWNLVMTCRYLLEHGYHYLNAGGYDGGGAGLPAHKERFAHQEDNVASRAFYTSYPHHTFDGYSDTQLPDIGE